MLHPFRKHPKSSKGNRLDHGNRLKEVTSSCFEETCQQLEETIFARTLRPTFDMVRRNHSIGHIVKGGDYPSTSSCPCLTRTWHNCYNVMAFFQIGTSEPLHIAGKDN